MVFNEVKGGYMRIITNQPQINCVYFQSKIIDSHAHVGSLGGSAYLKSDLDVFVKSELPNKDNIEKMFVSDIDVLTSSKKEYEGNLALLKLFEKDNKYSLLASCSPKNGDVKNIEKLFNENPNKFLGLKFHSPIQNLALSDEKYKPYMEFAEKNKLPCLFHSQVELLQDGKINPKLKHIADPEEIYTLAKKYPKTPVIMAHLGSGWNEAHDKAIDILVQSIEKGDANLYADISWVDIDHSQTHIVKAIKRLKGIDEKDWKYGDQSFRLMFGTDAPLSRFKESNARETYSNYVEAIKISIRNDKDLRPEAEKIIDNLFYNNAEKLFSSPKQAQSFTKSSASKTNTKWKYFLGVTGILALGGAICYNKSNKKEKI